MKSKCAKQNNEPLAPDQLLVFDFDGVISNSVHDSFRTAVNTYFSLYPQHALPLSGPVDPAEDIFKLEKSQPAFFQSFCQLMPFGNRAEDYMIILKIIEQDKTPDITDQQAYNQFKRGLPSSELEKYHQAFYQLRRSHQTDPVSWTKLLPAFPGVVEAIQRLSERFVLAIATSKDRISVQIQLKSYRLSDCFSPECIVDKDMSDSKRSHLEYLQSVYRLPFHRIHFIDDKVLHLISVADLGVRCYLALWGFNTPREHQLAREHGFRLLVLEDLIKLK